MGVWGERRAAAVSCTTRVSGIERSRNVSAITRKRSATRWLMVPGSPIAPALTPVSDLDALVDAIDRVDMELGAPHRLDGFAIQHQVGDIGARDEHALRAGETGRLTDPVEALDFLVDAADRLNAARADRPSR